MKPDPVLSIATAPHEQPLLGPLIDMLDQLSIAACAFDEEDRTLRWNRSFEKIFPEHAGHVYLGEPYRDNLRRFYSARLDAREMLAIERYIDEGVARHRAQHRPFTFEHLGRQLQVASLPLPGIGRLRIWRARDVKASLGSSEAATQVFLESLPTDGSALFDQLADGVMVTGPEDRIEWVNEAFVVLYGLRNRKAVIGGKLEDVYRLAWRGREGDDPTAFGDGLSILGETMRFAGAQFEVSLPDMRCARVVGQRSDAGMGFSVHVDISVMKRQQRALLDAERHARVSEQMLAEKSALLEATLERMEQGVMMIDADRTVQVCNRRAIELLELPPALMARKPKFAEVLAYQDSVAEFVDLRDEVMDILRGGGLLEHAHVYERKRPNGKVIEIQSVPMDGGGLLRTYTDITERRINEDRIRHVARHDGLTSLVTRDVFLECLSEAVAASTTSNIAFAVHYIDLDRFKPINDQYGHEIGDHVLTVTAERMRQIARDADIVARMGGDEFAILQLRVERPGNALGLAQRILRGLAEPILINGLTVDIGTSIGIAIYPEGGTTPETLIRHADSAMYAAKAKGHSAHIFDPARDGDAA